MEAAGSATSGFDPWNSWDACSGDSDNSGDSDKHYWPASLREGIASARFYAITAAGRRRLAALAEDWERMAGVMARLLRLSPDP